MADIERKEQEVPKYVKVREVMQLCEVSESRAYMVDCSVLVIAVHDGRKSGGTAATIRYANRMGCTLREIKL